jgi:hypothetical protein
MTDRLTHLESTVEELKQAFQSHVGVSQEHHDNSVSQGLGHGARPASDLYESDFMAWCEGQAEALRSRAFDQLDLINLIEEIEDMGREQFRKTTSLVRQILIHILKLKAFPQDQAVNHWRSEIAAFQNDLEDIVSGFIRYRFEQREEFAVQQQKALKQLQKQFPDVEFQRLEAMTLDEIMIWPEKVP